MARKTVNQMTDKEMREYYRNRVKKNNEAAKEKFDRFSFAVSKTETVKERIEKQGYKVNAFVVAAVLERLERLEQSDTSRAVPSRPSRLDREADQEGTESIVPFM